MHDFDRGDGVCRHLDLDTNECRIYESRPEVCRIDLMYDKHFSTLYSKDRFYKMNAQACNVMQEEAGIDVSFRIKIESRF